MEKMIENIHKDLDDHDEITIAFQGGEPTLAGLPWFTHFVESMGSRKKVKINYALQTNGILIDDAWAEFLSQNKFLTGLSIDANPKLHDANRRDTLGNGTYEACLKSKAILEKHKAEYNVLCVLTNELAAEPDKVWRFIIREKINFIQFIPCLESLDEGEASAFALRPARFASFYVRLYYWWMKALENGAYYSIKLFDDIANYFFRGVPTSCDINGRCHVQYVVEPDASVYPCDFYVLGQYNAGKLSTRTLHELFDSPVTQGFLGEERMLPELCRSCSYIKYCNGGCKRMSNAMYFGVSGSPSFGSVCGYKIFLDKCLRPLEHTVARYFSSPQIAGK
jgi:uncharacterized protein